MSTATHDLARWCPSRLGAFARRESLRSRISACICRSCRPTLRSRQLNSCERWRTNDLSLSTSSVIVLLTQAESKLWPILCFARSMALQAPAIVYSERLGTVTAKGQARHRATDQRDDYRLTQVETWWLSTRLLFLIWSIWDQIKASLRQRWAHVASEFRPRENALALHLLASARKVRILRVKSAQVLQRMYHRQLHALRKAQNSRLNRIFRTRVTLLSLPFCRQCSNVECSNPLRRLKTIRVSINRALIWKIHQPILEAKTTGMIPKLTERWQLMSLQDLAILQSNSSSYKIALKLEAKLSTQQIQQSNSEMKATRRWPQQTPKQTSWRNRSSHQLSMKYPRQASTQDLTSWCSTLKRFSVWSTHRSWERRTS